MAESLWQSIEWQLVWLLAALAGAALLPGRSLGERLGLGPGRLRPASLALALLGFVLLSHGLYGAIVALGLFEGSAVAELERMVGETSGWQAVLALLAIGLAPALGEELLFRGLVLRWVGIRVEGRAAVVGSAGV